MPDNQSLAVHLESVTAPRGGVVQSKMMPPQGERYDAQAVAVLDSERSSNGRPA